MVFMPIKRKFQMIHDFKNASRREHIKQETKKHDVKRANLQINQNTSSIYITYSNHKKAVAYILSLYAS
jgi:hypothetical protein